MIIIIIIIYYYFNQHLNIVSLKKWTDFYFNFQEWYSVNIYQLEDISSLLQP